MFFNSKYKVTLIDENWNVIKQQFPISSLPRENDYIYIVEKLKYYSVIKIIYYLNDGKITNHFIVVKEIENKFLKKLDT